MHFDILADGYSLLRIQADEFEHWMQEALNTRLQNFGTEIICYSPTGYPYKIKDHKQSNIQSFPSLSVTGISCSLGCEHCKGRLLRGMEPAITPELLFERCMEIKKHGGQGVLISGGSGSNGHVPIDRFGATILRVKSELGLQVVVHTGLVTPGTAQILGEAQVDAAMLDVIGDASVASKVYHISDGPRKMRQSLDILEEHNVPTVPHILVGLDDGNIHGEIEALQLIAQGKPSAVVIIALSPLRKTPMEHVPAPSPDLIGRIMTIARLGFRNTPVLLGCARPMGQHKIDTDRFAVRSGMNGVALMSQEGVDFARQMGLTPVFEDVCCSLAYKALS